MFGVIRALRFCEDAFVDQPMRDRLFSWLLVLLIAAGAFFGLAPFLLPTQFAALFGFAGSDVLMYRIAGAATFGYGVGLAAAYRASWPELRVAIASTGVFNLGSLVACALAIATGGTQPVVYLIAVASLLFAPACLYFVARPPGNRPVLPAADDYPLATWVVALFVIGTLSALVFGVAALVIAGPFGHSLGYPGLDDFIYRQGGAATLGAGIGGIMVLLNRRWVSARVPTLMALVFNGLSVVAVLLDIYSGSAQPIAFVILGAAALVTVGTTAALIRQGR
jgi:hypothetical protein